MNGSSSDFSVHSENGTEYLRKTNCLRQEKGEISSQAFLCVLLLLFSSRAIFVKRVRINEIEWQVSEPLGQEPLWLLRDNVSMTAGPLIDAVRQQPMFWGV